MRSSESRSLVVTGGSSGIGAAVSLAAARNGWHVWIGYAKGRNRALALATDIGNLGQSATPIRLPLDDADALRVGVETMAAGPLPPSAAVLCGGLPPDVGPLLKQTPDLFRRQLECAVVGHAVFLSELWRRCFRGRGGGHVLAVLSAAQGPSVAPHMASYVAAKGGFEALLRATLAELGPAGLRVSVARPSYVETPMLDAFDERFLDRARRQTSSGRFLQPCEVAGALVAALRKPPETATVGEIALEQPQAVFA